MLSSLPCVDQNIPLSTQNVQATKQRTPADGILHGPGWKQEENPVWVQKMAPHPVWDLGKALIKKIRFCCHNKNFAVKRKGNVPCIENPESKIIWSQASGKQPAWHRCQKHCGEMEVNGLGC